MKTSINEFLSILADNEFKAKYKEIPDDFDNRDELLAELHENLEDSGTLPDSLRYFEVNGISNPEELRVYLEKSFRQFRIEFLSGSNSKNKHLIKEILNQVEVIQTQLLQVWCEGQQIDDEGLLELIDLKIRQCKDLNEFIKNPQNYIKTSDSEDNQNLSASVAKPKKEKKILSFKWLIGKEKLKELYANLKANKLIAEDTQEEDFILVFSAVPIETIKKTIQWEKGAKLFVYFLRKLIDDRYIPQRPTWIILKYLFTYFSHEEGKYIPIPENIKANMGGFKTSGNPKDDELVDSLFYS